MTTISWMPTANNPDRFIGEPGDYVIDVVRTDNKIGRIWFCMVYRGQDWIGRGQAPIGEAASIVKAKALAERHAALSASQEEKP